jgi:putative transposase
MEETINTKEMTVGADKISTVKYYVVFEVKGHLLALDDEVKQELESTILSCREKRRARVIDYHIGPYHVHIIADIPPNVPVRLGINLFKRLTNIVVWMRFPKLVKGTYGRSGYIWSPGYYVRSLGMNEENPLNAIRKQGLEESKKPGSPALKAIEAQPK